MHAQFASGKIAIPCSVNEGGTWGATFPPPQRGIEAALRKVTGWIRLATRAVCLVGIVAAAALPLGCRTTDRDLQRWASSEQGPAKLTAVMSHDKYSPELRVQAALALVGMKPRAGQQAGLDRMMNALLGLPSSERTRLITELVPKLIAELDKPAPTRADQPDTTLPFKDAAFALLTHPGEPLISNPTTRGQVARALTRWANTGFSQRLEDTSQKYGLVQVLRHLGAPGVAALPDLMQPGLTKLDPLTSLIAELGDARTKVQASQRLVALARDIESQRWFDATLQPMLEGPNALSAEKAREQAVNLQSQELLQVFGSMRRLGQPPSVDYLLALASDGSKPDERRAAALAALEGQLEPRRGPQVSQLYTLADDPKTPTLVRDMALRRMADLPRQEVVSDFYRLFRRGQWKTRWLAAELVLRMSESRHLAEFMSQLRPVRTLAMVEAKRYGTLLSELKNPAGANDSKRASASDVADAQWMAEAMREYAQRSEQLAVRLTALAYYWVSGSNDQIPDVARHERDATPIRTCDDDPACSWQCNVEQDGRAEPKQPAEPTVADQQLGTVGDFVHFCVLPAMRGRQPSPAPVAAAAGGR